MARAAVVGADLVDAALGLAAIRRDGRITTPESFAATIPPGTIARFAATSIDTLTALGIGREFLTAHAYAQIAAATRDAAQHPSTET
jgi:hypothetical protein